jgi:hypothetical protein
MEDSLRTYLIGKRIETIGFFHNTTWSVDMGTGNSWLVSGGVEFKLDDGYFTFGWHHSSDCISASTNRFMDVYEKDNIKEIDISQFKEINGLTRLKITDVDVHIVNEELIDGLGPDLVLEMIITFENKIDLHLAAVEFRGKGRRKPTYDMYGDVLMSIGKRDIKF